MTHRTNGSFTLNVAGFKPANMPDCQDVVSVIKGVERMHRTCSVAARLCRRALPRAASWSVNSPILRERRWCSGKKRRRRKLDGGQPYISNRRVGSVRRALINQMRIQGCVGNFQTPVDLYVFARTVNRIRESAPGASRTRYNVRICRVKASLARL